MTDLRVHGIFSLLALGCLVGLFFTAWQCLIVDAVRQKIFEVRDGALLWAYDNNRLTDDAYRNFRLVLNVTIRHFENVSFLKMLLLSELFHIDDSDVEEFVRQEFLFRKDEHLNKEFRRVMIIFGVGVLLRSPILLVIVPMIYPFLLTSGLLSSNKESPPTRLANRISRHIEANILHRA